MAKIQGIVQALVNLALSRTAGNSQVSAQVNLGAPALAIPADADGCWDIKGNLAASGTVSHDLAGALEDPLGQATAFSKVYALALYAEPGNVNNVELGGAAANAFPGPFKDPTDIVAVPPGGTFLATNAAGWTVTPGTGDLLKVTNSGAGSAVNYRLIVLGDVA